MYLGKYNSRRIDMRIKWDIYFDFSALVKQADNRLYTGRSKLGTSNNYVPELPDFIPYFKFYPDRKDFEFQIKLFFSQMWSGSNILNLDRGFPDRYYLFWLWLNKITHNTKAMQLLTLKYVAANMAIQSIMQIRLGKLYSNIITCT